MTIVPSDQWRQLKQSLLEHWNQLTEKELEATQRKPQEIINLIRFRLGLTLDEASRKFSEMLERIEKFEVPHEVSPQVNKNKKETVKKLAPPPPANRDRKPKDKFHL